jgi:hypothetical protein
VSRRKLNRRRDLAGRLGRAVELEVVERRAGQQELLEVGPALLRAPILIGGHDDDDLLAVACHHLGTFLERASNELAETLLCLLHLPVHNDAQPFCLDSPD